MEIGRLCMKIAGRDAGKKCVILKVVDERHVIIDGETRRKRCNKRHIMHLDKTLKVKEDAPHGEVVKAFKELGITIKPKKAAEKAAPEKVSAKKN